jgi:serine protease Do
MAKALGLDKAKGVLVQSVIKGGAGDESGIKEGDVIFSVDGKEVNAPNELQVIIGSHHPGESVKLVVFRDGKTFDKDVTLKPKTEDTNQTAQNNNKQNDESSKGETSSKSITSIGVSVSPLSSSLRDKLKVDGGVVVNSVDNYSDAFLRGLRKGMVIVEANKRTVNSADDLADAVKGKSKGDSILLKVYDQTGQERILAIQVQ